MEIAMARVGIISVDGHAKPSWAAYRDYLDPPWRERYDDWVKPFMATPDFCHSALGQDAQWDAGRRVADLEAQGVVAEVVFPNGATPFASGDPEGRDVEAVRAGYRAHNRWLADLCSEVPGRIFPQALVDFADIDAAVKEIQAAKQNGFVGVVMPPLVQGAQDSRYFFDPALDPIWAACVEAGLPISQHGGEGAPNYRPPGMAAFLVLATEHSFFSGRSLWQLILGGVFDRFPRLKVAYVETEAWWLRPVMELLDRRDLFGDDWAKASGRGGNRPYARLPSDYLRTNIAFGISPFVKSIALDSFDDGKEREIITSGNAMIGADYPHPETALLELREAVDQFGALPNITAEGARKVIFGNAARLYGIDLARLQPHIERVGFELEPAPM
jgi:predicted TIM-barrel fold metal-dependent hydrolase